MSEIRENWEFTLWMANVFWWMRHGEEKEAR